MSFKRYIKLTRKLRDLKRVDDAEAYRLKNERSRLLRKLLTKYGFLFLCALATLIVVWCILVSLFGV